MSVNQITENTITNKNLVQLARLALAGRPQDVQMYIRRMARRYQPTEPELSGELIALLREAPTRDAPIRGNGTTAVPVDVDSRLQLLRVEQVSDLEVEPIWAKAVGDALEQIVSERNYQEQLQVAGLFPTRSILFTGPPGVGKSLAARWLAHQLQLPLLILDLSAVMSSFLGRTGTNLRYVLDYAKSISCILFLDELDAIAKRRDDVGEIGELKRLVTVMLQEIDDWSASGLLLAATNHADLLDPAVWRRFDLHLSFPMPDPDQVKQATTAFLSSTDPKLQPWHDVLSVVFQGMSFNDIERQLLFMRRESIVQQLPLDQIVQRFTTDHIKSLPSIKRRKIASLLVGSHLTQRQINEITGVSRDTIRKTQSEPSPT